MTTSRNESAPRAGVIGLGLIGGSVALALRRAGYEVVGADANPTTEADALERHVVSELLTTPDPTLDFVVVATPVDRLEAAVRAALDLAPRAVVTDVGSVKAGIAAAVADPRFVPGHPMAGSELSGLAGARVDLFDEALWVLTPTPHTSGASFATAHAAVGSLGAEVVALAPERHDQLVALVSHVPHLVAASLMNLASASADDHALLLRLAAGGFRDMTRVAAGEPDIWPSICVANGDSIVRGLDDLIDLLQTVRTAVEDADRASLRSTLQAASTARRALPGRRSAAAEELGELVVPIPDRPGALAGITTTASELGVNIDNIEVTHTMEGDSGIAVLWVPRGRRAELQEALSRKGFRSVVRGDG